MRKRYVYAMLFGFPGLLLAGAVSLGVFSGAAGFVWLFVLGDDAWPSAVGDALVLLLATSFVLVWGTSVVLGFVVGKRLERTPRVDPRHVAASAAVAGVVIVGFLVHQHAIGNLGPASDGALCRDFCSARGYAASGLPPRDSGSRTCTCFDGRGGEALSVSLERITAGE